MGYNNEIRLFSKPASSDNWITGRPSTSSSSGGWGRESRSLKNGDDMASTDLRTRKLTLSDDRTIIFASGMSKHNNRDGGSEFSEVGSSFESQSRVCLWVFVLVIAMKPITPVLRTFSIVL